MQKANIEPHPNQLQMLQEGCPAFNSLKSCEKLPGPRPDATLLIGQIRLAICTNTSGTLDKYI